MRHRQAAATALVALLSAAAVRAQPTPPASAQQATEQPAPRPAQIDRNGVLILIRSNLLALNQANETGNYTVLRDLGAPGFREANTAARLAEIFANQRAQKLDLSGVAVLEPQLTILPQIEGNGLMRLGGFFPSVPSQVNFELIFAPVESRWQLFGIAVTIGSSTPTAPPPPPPPAAARPEAAKPAPKPPAPPSAARTPRAAEPPAAREAGPPRPP